MKEQYVDLVWKKNPEYIRNYHKNKPSYQKLCDEVKFILEKCISDSEVETASISARAKPEGSFCEKIYRKEYADPFSEITDFAGARVVYLYSADRSTLESIVEKNFDVIEKVDKILGSDVDQFGYGALHYLVKLKTDYLKARYPDLENLICEVQVRTILQDAWAVVAHHLSYKQESDIPRHLRRKLNALSGLFETADDQFESIRGLRESYQNSLLDNIQKDQSHILDEDITADSLKAYLAWKFPERDSASDRNLNSLISQLKEYGYLKLNELNEMVDSAIDAVEAYEAAYPPSGENDQDTKFLTIGVVRVALEYMEPSFMGKNKSKTLTNQKLEFSHLIKQKK
ncbi:GTP pyrophosphokinase [Vibrio campbellii]|uniref:GTP pyrophosphokinase n=1 Tax=Vibrio campbellii TaxID=680 RepID=UPI00210D6014|nr:hypothetical protein [Vibrio campbellii]UTZ42779.1 hypothetical protein HB764_15665 [Vibrio campbellii]UTZ44405.1 hypothetical protein HB764_24850 [Vibrio campbellii]